MNATLLFFQHDPTFFPFFQKYEHNPIFLENHIDMYLKVLSYDFVYYLSNYLCLYVRYLTL